MNFKIDHEDLYLQYSTKTEHFNIEMSTLQMEIEELEGRLENNEFRQSTLYDSGVSSVFPVMLAFAKYPIAIHIIMKIMCLFMTVPDFIIGPLPIYASTALALYFSVPTALTILCLAMISKKAHKDYIKKSDYLEAEAEELEEQLAEKQEKYEDLENSLIIESEKVNTSTEDDYQRRAELITTLEKFRSQITTHYNDGTLDEYLESLGFAPQKIATQKEAIAKTLKFKKKDKREK